VAAAHADARRAVRGHSRGGGVAVETRATSASTRTTARRPTTVPTCSPSGCSRSSTRAEPDERAMIEARGRGRG
jgi:hypothetical protein